MDEAGSVSYSGQRFLDRSKHLHVLNRELNPSRGFISSIENRYELEQWKNLPNQSIYNSTYSLGYIVAADVDYDSNEYLLYCSENRFIRMCKVKHLRDKKTIYMKYFGFCSLTCSVSFEVRSAAYVQLGPSLETYLVGTNDGSIKLFSLEDSIMLENIQVSDSYAAKKKHQADIFDFISGNRNLSIATNGGECTAVCWNPYDSHVITLGTSEGRIEHYDMRKTKVVLHSSNIFTDRVITVNYTEDGLYLVVLYSDRRIIVFDAICLEKLAVAHLPPRLHGLPLQNVGLHLRVHSCGHSIFIGIPCRELCYYVEVDMITKSFKVQNLRSPFGGMTCCAFVPIKQHFLTFGRAQLTWQATLEDAKGIVRTIHTDNWDDTECQR
ncbi:unnamed protein product [Auanema sp. JU1783]|nr:unnamed protein product [Auanema sp. JU1783]